MAARYVEALIVPSPNLPPPNFDAVARVYRWAEYLALGPLLQRTRTHFLPQLAGSRLALLFGDGDGRFLAALLRQNPETTATAVDSSEEMLRLLRRRSSGRALTTCHCDAFAHQADPRTDLIVTHFFLDCFSQSEVERLATNLAAQVQPGTLWLLSDFRVPDGRLLGMVARAYIRFLYLAFRLLTGLRVRELPDPQTALSAAGFRREQQHRRLGGLLYTELWRLTANGKSYPLE